MLSVKSYSPISSAAVHILAKGYGYRSEDYSDTDVIASNIQILDHEINDLGNDDIVDFVENHYGLPEKVVRDEDDLVKRDEYNCVIQHGLVRQIDSRIKDILHTQSYDLLWLCNSVKDVISSDYAESKDSIYKEVLSKNNDPKNYILLSDLDSEGCLFAIVY